MSTATALSGPPEMLAPRGTIRPAAPSPSANAAARDLARINEVVAASLGSWALPARVRRLALPSLLYDEVDLEMMTVVLVEEFESGIAVAAWEAAAGRDAVPGSRSVLLHGLYVVPSSQGQGLGTALLDLASHWMLARGFDAITARVWRESEPFFQNRGFVPLTQSDTDGSYPRQMWRALQ